MAEENLMSDLSIDEYENLSLCEALDRVLNKGAVVVGELTISVADVDLLYLGLQVILSSIETARGILPGRNGPLSLAAKDKGGGNAGRLIKRPKMEERRTRRDGTLSGMDGVEDVYHRKRTGGSKRFWPGEPPVSVYACPGRAVEPQPR
jgi:gas vesicle structural protein